MHAGTDPLPLDEMPLSDLLVLGLQALWRERVTAWRVAGEVAERNGGPPPTQEMFGVEEVDRLLRLLGAGPIKF
jgi:hypothetical protein